MKNLRFEKPYKGEKAEEGQREQEYKEFERAMAFASGEIPFENRFNFSDGGELFATTDQNGIGHVGIMNKGKVFDFASLLPEGYKFVTPAYFQKHPEEETLWDYVGGTWANRPEGKVVLLGEFQSSQDILIFLHEIGHARGDKPEETKLHEKLDRELTDERIARAIKEGDVKEAEQGWRRRKSEMEVLLNEDLAKTLSVVERRAWANAIRMLRQVQKETGVDMKSIFPDFNSVKQYINKCLGSYRRSYEWVIKDGYDPDFYKELQQLFDKWQYETAPKAEQEGARGMKLIEGHPICGDCLKNQHGHSTERGERHDCKNTDEINEKTYQCHCGFSGVYKDNLWQSWEE